MMRCPDLAIYPSASPRPGKITTRLIGLGNHSIDVLLLTTMSTSCNHHIETDNLISLKLLGPTCKSKGATTNSGNKHEE